MAAEEIVMTKKERELYLEYGKAYFEGRSIYYRYFSEHDYNDSDMSMSDWLLHYTNVTQKPLCGMAGLAKQTINGMVKEAMGQGYIRQEVCPEDRRSKYLVLTPAGRAYAEKMVRETEKREAKAFNNMSVEDRRKLIELMHEFSAQLAKELEVPVD